jgi:uncharacterized membrane protein YgcG
MRYIFCFLFITLFCAQALAIAIPYKPDNYINDYTHILSVNTISALNTQLKQYE